MKTILTFALAASALALPSAAIAQRAPGAVIVVVDSDAIYRDCAACRTAQASLKTRVASLQTRQQTLANQLRPEGQSLQTAVQALAGKAPDAALRARAEAFQKKQDDANQELARGQQNLQSIQANIVRQINERLNPVINQVMTARGANIAVDVNATLAHTQAVNVTADVLAGLNRALPTVSLTPLPAGQQPKQQPQGR